MWPEAGSEAAGWGGLVPGAGGCCSGPEGGQAALGPGKSPAQCLGSRHASAGGCLRAVGESPPRPRPCPCLHVA